MSFCLEQKIRYSRKIATFSTPSIRFRPHMGKSGKKCSSPPVRKVGSTRKRKMDRPIPSSTERPTISPSSFLLEKVRSSHCSNLEGSVVSSSG